MPVTSPLKPINKNLLLEGDPLCVPETQPETQEDADVGEANEEIWEPEVIIKEEEVVLGK